MGKKGFFALWKLNRRLLLAVLAGLLCGAAAFTVSALTAEEPPVPVPAVMYHAVLKDSSRHGKYVISPAEFESDLRYLKEHGYTTVVMEDLIAYTKGGTLPEKPVLLTFDDGYYNNYVYAFPLARQYGCRFVLSPIGCWTDRYSGASEENAYYSHVTWQELREMADSGLVEVQNHSYDLHKSDGARLGVRQLPGETRQEYEALLKSDLLKAQDAIETHVGKRPSAFVYPFGVTGGAAPELLKELGFSATLSCEEKISPVTRDPESLYGLGRFLRPSGISSREFFEKRMKLAP